MLDVMIELFCFAIKVLVVVFGHLAGGGAGGGGWDPSHRLELFRICRLTEGGQGARGGIVSGKAWGLAPRFELFCGLVI